MKTKNIKNSSAANSTATTSPVKSSKEHEQPMAFWFFILFAVGIAFSAIAWLGSLFASFPWLILGCGCLFLVYSIGLWLWGRKSIQPKVVVKTKVVYVVQPQKNNQVAEPTSKDPVETQKMLDLIFSDPDLQDDDDSESPEDAE